MAKPRPRAGILGNVAVGTVRERASARNCHAPATLRPETAAYPSIGSLRLLTDRRIAMSTMSRERARRTRWLVRGAVAAGCALLLAGCVVYPAGPGYYYGPGYYGYYGHPYYYR
jgi:hypothetical protein